MPTGVYRHRKGWHHTQDAKDKVRNAHLGGRHTQEHNQKISETLKGRLFSNEHRKKLSESGIGKSKSDEHRNKLSKAIKEAWQRGLCKSHRLTKSAKQKISASRMGKSPWNKDKKCPQYGGNNHWNWKGGVSPESERIRKSIEFRLWRESVFSRDNWTCQKCLHNKGHICSHHIKNFSQYPELRFAIDNGITFCRRCHDKFHVEYGKRNNTQIQLMDFLNHQIITKEPIKTFDIKNYHGGVKDWLSRIGG